MMAEILSNPISITIITQPIKTPLSEIPQGDPKMFVSSDGMTLKFENGLPVMDDGLENISTISLGTEANFAFNKVAKNSEESVGSSFIEESLKAITKNQISVVEDAAERSFDWMIKSGIANSVTASMVYVRDYGYQIKIVITPPTGEDRILVYSKNGENWVNQQKK